MFLFVIALINLLLLCNYSFCFAYILSPGKNIYGRSHQCVRLREKGEKIELVDDMPKQFKLRGKKPSSSLLLIIF